MKSCSNYMATNNSYTHRCIKDNRHKGVHVDGNGIWWFSRDGESSPLDRLTSWAPMWLLQVVFLLNLVSGILWGISKFLDLVVWVMGA